MINGKNLDREAFLAQPDVRDFIDWLCVNLPNLDVHLHFSPSRFVPGGLNRKVRGINQVLLQYRWANSWLDYQTGNLIQSDDFASTKLSLDLLRDRLQTALASGCQKTTFQACSSVLTWGGVRGAFPFLHRLQEQGELINYLSNCGPLFSLTGGQNLLDLNANSILRFDAGLTKIHAFADTTGSPIYDSRVGAAIAMLYALYRKTAKADRQLDFASGSSRAMQIRDPGELGYTHAPQFYTTAVSAPRWAQCQLELGWIMRKMLTRSPQLFDDSSIDRRCHSFEAALFMIGYDLRCLSSHGLPAHSAQGASPSQQKVQAAKTGGRTWVPTSVPFVQLLKEYLDSSLSAGRAVDLAEFRQWQIAVKQRKPSTANAYCAPFRESELDLANFAINDLILITQGGGVGLHALGSPEFIAGDEREQVYLVNVFLCGCSARILAPYSESANRVSANDLLVQAGFAGKQSSADLILRIGRAVGQHFELLLDGQPTAAFDAFFGKSLDDLEHHLCNMAVAISAAGNCVSGTGAK